MENTNYYNSGLHKLVQNDTDGAIEDFEKAIEIEPKHVVAYNKLGHSYSDKGDFDNAIRVYSKSLEIIDNPTIKGLLGNAYFKRGLTYLDKEDYKNAIISFSESIKIEDSTDYYHIRGLAYYNDGQVEAGIKDWEEVLKREPDNERVQQFLKQAKE
ncbi:hypothetical protein FACS189467_3140 [Bacteroidia bacterium]|nr:hypothetical protein FACS189467_3140 [Bacteroidia bacterium]